MKKIQTVILAGGKGTRLRPLTSETPKPCVEILSKSALCNILARLSRFGIKKALLTVMYKKERIFEQLKDVDFMDIACVSEDVPLGTAGGVKNALLSDKTGEYDDVLVISGDGVCDFDFEKLYSFHKEKNADVTIVTAKSARPLEYGIVLSNKDGKITNFCEKPPWAHVFSDAVNTGIYFIKRSVFQNVPEGVPYDFSNDLFPRLLNQKFALYACEAKGYWCDIGDVSAYFACNMDALRGKMEVCTGGGRLYTENEANIIAPSFICDGAQIDKSARIGPMAVIGRDVKVGSGTKISSCVVHSGAVFGKGCEIFGAVICRGAVFGDGCVVLRGSVIGANTLVGEQVKITKGVKIYENKNIKSGVCVVDDVIFENDARQLFSDGGIYLCGNFPNPARSAKTGAAIASALMKSKGKNVKIAVMHDADSVSKNCAGALICGMSGRNAQPFDLGDGFEAQSAYFAIGLMADLSVFVYTGKDGVYAKLFSQNSLCISRDLERKIEAEFLSDAQDGGTMFCESKEAFCISRVYYGELLRFAKGELCGKSFEGISLSLTPENEKNPAKDVFLSVFCALGGAVCERGDFVFEISKDARSLCVWEEERMYDKYHIMALLLKSEAEKENAHVAFSKLSPNVYKSVFGKETDFEQYDENPEKETVIPAENMRSLLWTNDMCFAAIKLFALLKKAGKSLFELSCALPSFEVYIEDIEEKEDTRARTMSRLSKKSPIQNGEGVCVVFEQGAATVVPKRAGGFKIMTEAVSFEAAQEIFEKVRSDITENQT